VKKHPFVWLVVVCVLGGGCSSKRELSRESRNAETAIERAEDAGAKKYDPANLEVAKDQLEASRAGEAAALRDRQKAHDLLLTAQKRDERAKLRLTNRKATLAEAEEERKNQLLTLDALKTHGEDLRRSGVPEADVTNMVEPQEQMVKIRIRTLDAQIASQKKEIEAMEAVRKDAGMEIDVAKARLKSSSERLQAARAGYVRVEEQANLARANSLAARRGQMSDQIGELTP